MGAPINAKLSLQASATFNMGAPVKLRKKKTRHLIDPTQIGRIQYNMFKGFKEPETSSMINGSAGKYSQTDA